MKIEKNEILDQGFWKKINSDLHVEDHIFLKQHKPVEIKSKDLNDLYTNLLEEGYFQAQQIELKLPTEKMAFAITNFYDMGWPTAFAFVYDEFFLLPYKLSSILSPLLGKDFKQLPDFWAWYIDPLKSEKGWDPHRDKGTDSLMENNMPKSVTIWIPLTNATTMNGCIYIVPMQWDPYFVDGKNNKFEYQHIRALPAQAGSILCWNQAILHWGGRSSKKAISPRISVGMEFQRGDIKAFNEPLLQIQPIPDLKLRLKLIGKQILQYKHMYPLSNEIEKIAKEMDNLQ